MIAGGAGEILVTAQKKGKIYDSSFVVLFITLVQTLTVVFGFIYLLFIPLFGKLFEVQINDYNLLWQLSVIIVLSKIPASFVSSLQQLLYAKDKYKYIVVSNLVSEIAGILTIIFLVKSYGIISFAYGMLVTPIVNSIFYLRGNDLSFGVAVKLKIWIEKKEELVSIFKRVFSLSFQTLLNHLSTFWERTLSFKFLPPGYLSALNYSKGLAELPSLAMMSSILTTTYIEQVNKKTENETEYSNYTNKMHKLLSEFSFFFQMLSVFFGPIILIFFFKRGAFDSFAVEKTFLIYQVLSIGFFPGLMVNFLSRLMYIEGEYKKLFYIVLFKFILEVSIMVIFIKLTSLAIPIALVAGKVFFSITMLYFLNNKNNAILNTSVFYKFMIAAILLSILLIIVNLQLLPLINNKSFWEIFLWYLPFIIITLIVTYKFVIKRIPKRSGK